MLSWDQPHVVVAGPGWNSGTWRTGAFATYRSGWPVTAFVTDPAQLPWRLNRERLSACFVLDANAGRVSDTSQGDIHVSQDVTNLTDRGNVAGILFREGPVREASYNLPVVLSLGVAWHRSR